MGVRLSCGLWILGAWLLAGCFSPPQPKAAKESSPRGKAGADPEFSPEAVERRTEAHAHYGTAIIHELNDEPERAAEELFQAALCDSANESLVLEATRRLFQLKQNDKALELLLKATAQPGASGNLFARLGLAYSLAGKKQQAIDANLTAIKKMPTSLAGYQNLVRIHLQDERPAEALQVLDQAAQQTGVDALFLIDLAELYTAVGRGHAAHAQPARERALAALERAAELNPAHPLLMQKLADGFALFGATEDAAAVYLKLLERFPNLPGLREKLAETYLRGKEPGKATEHLEAIVRNNPTNPQAYFLLGSIAFEEKKMKDAAEHFNKTILLNPNFEPAYYDLALAQINLDQARDALATLDKARGKFRQTFGGEFFTALAYTRLKDYSNAMNHFVAAEIVARATDTNRLTHIFYFQLGAACERNQKFDEAEKYLKKCLEMSPDFSEALNYLGYMWAERGVNLAEARALIEKALKLEPKNHAFLDSLAWVLFKLDKPSEALSWQLKAIELADEPDATLYDHLGDIYATLKEPLKAQEAWRKALSLEPSDTIRNKLQPDRPDGSSSAGPPPVPPAP